ncbi:MAG TPA: TonB-dependent receptor, partial [Pyrinomonadaceae bacterium]
PDVRAQNFSVFTNSFLSAPGSSTFVSNQLFLSYGRTGFDFEERRDESFLIPTRLDLNNPDERRFLLNARLLENRTLPGATFVNYVTNPSLTAEAQLGTPFEPVTSPVGQIIIAGYSPVGADVFTFPQRRTNNTYQLSDTVSVQTGRHSLAFGTDLRRSELNSQLPRNARPLILFSGAAKLRPTPPNGFPFVRIGSYNATDIAAAGAPNEVLQTLTTGDDSTIGLRYYQYNFFARDEWRVRPNLSLSVGLRYEFNSPPREMHRRIENTFEDPVLAIVGLDAFVNHRGGIFAPDRNNFAPRLGLVYSFGANDENIVRVGGGFYYDQAPGVVVSQSRSVVPTFFTFNIAGYYQHLENGTPVGLGIRVPSTLSIRFGCREDTDFFPIRQPGTLNTIDPRTTVGCLLQKYLIEQKGSPDVRPVLHTVLPALDLQMPMAYHYTAAFEHEFGRSTVVSVAYVGTQGRHLLRQTTPNLGEHAPLGVFDLHITDGRPRFGGITAQPTERGLDGVVVPRLSPQAGAVRIYEAAGNSRYDALQLQVGQRFTSGTSFQFNYTLSKVTDDVSDVFDLAGAPAL